MTTSPFSKRIAGWAATPIRTACPQPDGSALGIDTGFIVHNERTYPTLLRLFAELGVETQDSEMSMSVRCDGCGLEYAGARDGARGIIARPSSLLRGRYLLMLVEVMRFYRRARALIQAVPASSVDPQAAARSRPLASFWRGNASAPTSSRIS